MSVGTAYRRAAAPFAKVVAGHILRRLLGAWLVETLLGGDVGRLKASGFPRSDLYNQRKQFSLIFKVKKPVEFGFHPEDAAILIAALQRNQNAETKRIFGDVPSKSGRVLRARVTTTGHLDLVDDVP